MDIKRFWQLINQTRKDSAGDPKVQARLLVEAVSSLSLEEI
jgi:hypothetical protein